MSQTLYQWLLKHFPLQQLSKATSYCILTNGETMGLRISIIFQIMECNWICLTLEDVIFLILASFWNCEG